MLIIARQTTRFGFDIYDFLHFVVFCVEIITMCVFFKQLFTKGFEQMLEKKVILKSKSSKLLKSLLQIIYFNCCAKNMFSI